MESANGDVLSGKENSDSEKSDDNGTNEEGAVGGLRRSKRQNKGVPPLRLGQSILESTRIDSTEKERAKVPPNDEDDSLEDENTILKRTLLQTQIERNESKMALLEMSKELRKLQLKEYRSATQEKQQEVNQSVRKPDNKVSGNQQQSAQNEMMNVIKEQTEQMNRFMSRQTLGQDSYMYDGKLEEWPLFRAWYDNTTKVCAFNDIENLLRLQKSLKGPAREAVQTLLYSPENCSRIMSTLERRFGRPEYLIKTLIAKAKEVPPVREENPMSVIEFSNAVTNLVASLTTFKQSNYIDNPQLLDEFLGKLPLAMQVQWSEFVMFRDTCSLETFSLWMDVRATAASKRLQFNSGKVEGNSGKKSAKNSQKKDTRNVKTVATVAATETGPKCSLCEEQHFIADCNGYKSCTVDEKWNIIKEKKLCFICLKRGHRSPQCKAKKCSVNNCGRKHHNSVHNETSTVTSSTPAQSPPSVDATPASQNIVGTATQAIATNGQVFMMILPVIVSGPKGWIKTAALLDAGSSITMIKTSLADKLGLQGTVKPLAWRGTTPNVCTDKNSRVVQMRIKGTFCNAQEYNMHHARTVNDLMLPRQTVDIEKLSKNWRYLAEAPVEPLHDVAPEILIGLDNAGLIIPREVIHGPMDAPFVAQTLLGWVILGGTQGQDVHVQLVNCVAEESIDELHELVKKTFSMDSFGASPRRERILPESDQKALEIMESTIRQTNDGRYEVGLLWRKGDYPKVPESRVTAMKRLFSTERRLDREPALAEDYYKKMQEHIEKGYLVKVNENDVKVSADKKWFLPHFAVINPTKKKVRVVFDCAAKSHGVSLNDLLLKGPDLLQSLPAVLMNFRRGKYGITGDIREMFHRVKVRKEDQNYQRILWRGENREIPPEEFILTVNTFGASCSPAVASFVKNYHARKYREKYPTAVEEILRFMYCDDFISCANTVKEAREKIDQVIEIHKSAGFDIVNWSASDPQILDSLDKSDQVKNLNDSDNLDRVLGLWWDSAQDAFVFRLSFHKVPEEALTGEFIPTKREVLRIVMSIFDPLGFIGPLTVKGKMVMQLIWGQKINWDDKIKDDSLANWWKFLRELRQITSVVIPRCYSGRLFDAFSVQLHVFGDASSTAIAAVAYLRIESNGGVEVVLVGSRTRVAPLKAVTIPRLELNAAVLCSLLSDTVMSDLHVKIDKQFHWSDSKTVLAWLKNDSRRFKQYVCNRVGEIHEYTDVNSWNWVPGKENPADLATRMIPTDYSTDAMWFRGPEFLRFNEESWPLGRVTADDEDSSEYKPEIVNIQYKYEVDPLTTDATRVSHWVRLLHATARVRNAAMKWKTYHRKEGTVIRRPLKNWGHLVEKITLEELGVAEKSLWREMQRKYLPEIHRLKRGEPIDKNSSLRGYSPFVDEEGILRMRSRLINCPEDIEIFPVILDAKHPATKLLILAEHENNMHQGRDQVVNILRERFDFPGIRAAVKSSWSDCQRCKNLAACPRPPEMAALPLARVEQPPSPFARTGLDYFGPIMITQGRKQLKRWGVLFTCMATRAIHLEIAHSLSTDSAIQAILRFNLEKGPVEEIYCDNGTNFKGAGNELKKAINEMDHEKIGETILLMKIKWFFNPPLAPHFGGAWERLVRSVKTAMKATLAFHAPTDEALKTIFAEAQFVINNRPLTHVSVDPHDPTALTPNKLLGKRACAQVSGVFSDEDFYLRMAWRKAQRYVDHFWRRWVKEYLPELARRSKWYDDVPNIKKGDVVVIADGNLPRNDWPLGIIEEVLPGSDEKVRIVMVRTARGLYKRPASKICVLDVRESVP